MITVNRGSSFSLFDYWKKPVTGYPGRYSQNHHSIVVIEIQDWLSPSPESYDTWSQGENSRLIASLYTTGIIQIPIDSRYFEISCLRPAVSSLGACPTPAR